jgi:hypothetical protein
MKENLRCLQGIYTTYSWSSTFLKIDKKNIEKDGYYRFVCDINDITFTDDEEYILVLYTDDGKDEIIRKKIKASDLFEYIEYCYRGTQSIITWLNRESIIDNISFGIIIDEESLGSIECSVKIDRVDVQTILDYEV